MTSAAFTDAVERLLDDDDLRGSMGRLARTRVSKDLDWRAQHPKYVDVFRRLIGSPQLSEPLIAPVVVDTGAEPAPADHRGRRFVDLADPERFDDFIVNRTTP